MTNMLNSKNSNSNPEHLWHFFPTNTHTPPPVFGHCQKYESNMRDDYLTY